MFFELEIYYAVNELNKRWREAEKFVRSIVIDGFYLQEPSELE